MPIIVPLISVVSRDTGESQFRVCDPADTRTCPSLIRANVSAGSARLYTEGWQRYRWSHPAHAMVRHGVHERARDADGNGRQSVHGNTCEGLGTTLRMYLHVFRGVHKQCLHLYVATYEAMVNTKRAHPR